MPGASFSDDVHRVQVHPRSRPAAPSRGRPIEYDLRHTFGTRTIAKADILRVKAWMGHADAQTTMR